MDYTKQVRLSTKPCTDRLGEFRRARPSAKITGPDTPFGQDVLQRFHDSIGDGAFIYVPQHQDPGQQQCRGIRNIFARDVGRAAVDGLEDADVGTEVRAWYNPEAPYKSCTEI